MDELAHLRKLLDDDPAFEQEVSTALGDELEFLVSNPPITAETVRVNGAAQSSPGDYDVVDVNGVPAKVVFVSPPPADARVEVSYTRQTWSDDELQSYLDLAAVDWAEQAGKVYRAGIMAIDGLLTGAATALDFGPPQEGGVEMTSVFSRLITLRSTLAQALASEGARPFVLDPSTER